jgi:hypothetical protein
MEANGIDFSLRYPELHGYLTEPEESPLQDPKGLTHIEERDIVLALRDRIRRELGMPPLTDKERASWQYGGQEYLGPRGDLARPWTYHSTSEEGEAFINLIAERAPQLMEALQLVANHNARCGEDYKSMVSTVWLGYPLKHVLSQIRPDLSSLDLHHLLIAIIDQVHEEAVGV